MTRITNLLLVSLLFISSAGASYAISALYINTPTQAVATPEPHQNNSTHISDTIDTQDAHNHEHGNHTTTSVDTTTAGITHVSDEKIVISSAVIETLPIHQFAPGSGHTGHITVDSGQVTAPFDLWITGKTFHIKNAAYYNLHHANLFRPDMRSFTCEGMYWRDLLSIGSDTMYQNSFNLPEGYAVFIPAGAPLRLDVMFHNPETEGGQDLHNVQGEIELTLAPSDKINQLKKAEYIRLELTDNPCSGGGDSYVFTVPPNTKEYVIGQEYTSNEPFVYTFTTSGRIVYAGGHVHGWEGGEKLDIFLNNEAILSYQTSKSSPHPFHYQTEHKVEDIKIKAGDVLRLESTYNNLSSYPVPGAMGMFGMFFVAD